MPKGKLSDTERAEIIATLRETENVRETARRHERGIATVSRIATEEGLHVAERSRTKAARAALVEDNAVKRARIIALNYEAAERLHCQLFAPCVERKAMSVSDGMQSGSHVEIVEIEHDEPTFHEKNRIVGSIKMLGDSARTLESVDDGSGDAALGLLERLFDGIKGGQ